MLFLTVIFYGTLITPMNVQLDCGLKSTTINKNRCGLNRLTANVMTGS